MSPIIRLPWTHSRNNAGNNAGNTLRNKLAMFNGHSDSPLMNALSGDLFLLGGGALAC